MQVFYNPSVKRYVVFTAIAFFLIAIPLRIFLPAFSLKEIAFHIWLRTLLGYPTIYYSNLSLFFLTVLYQMLYLMLGGGVGYLLFRLIHRKHGFTLLIAKRFRGVFGVLFFIFLFFFLKVDMVNPYQNSVGLPALSAKIPQGWKDTLSYMFLPSMVRNDGVYTPLARQYSRSYSAKQLDQQKAAQQQNQTPPDQSTNPPFVPPSQPDQTQSQTQNQPPVQQKSMPGSQELLIALNAYRQKNGRNPLTQDSKLTAYAQQRAELFNRNGATDNSQGFIQYVYNEGGNYKLGFHNVGENSGYNVVMSGTNMIENYFGKYPANNSTQLKSDWRFVGIGVSGTAVDFVFGGTLCTQDYCN